MFPRINTARQKINGVNYASAEKLINRNTFNFVINGFSEKLKYQNCSPSSETPIRFGKAAKRRKCVRSDSERAEAENIYLVERNEALIGGRLRGRAGTM